MSRLLAASAFLLLLLTACNGGHSRRSAAPPAVGPPGVVRVALAHLRWPLDPGFVEGRDETTVARALFATPLRTDPTTNALRPGLCQTWAESQGGRTWRFRCRHARAVAATLRRAARLPASPSAWLFSDITGVSARRDQTLVVRLRRPWRRFPYALTVPAAAPRGVRGPFRLVRAGPDRIVARRAGLTLVFRRLDPHAAARAFRRGEVDEAPVPLGDIRAALADESLRGRVRVQRLLGLDLVEFNLQTGPLSDLSDLRRAYWQTAPRADYRGLVAEDAAPSAFGLVADAPSTRGSAAAARRGANAVPQLPAVHVPVVVDRAADFVYGAHLVVARWRELGLGPTVKPSASRRQGVATGLAGGWFRRLVAAYPEPEALVGAVLLSGDQSPWLGRPSSAERLLWRALASTEPHDDLAKADAAVEDAAAVVPLAWLADARLVSPRLRGWREDVLGDVDYTAVSPG